MGGSAPGRRHPVCHDGRWYCLTRYVPGSPAGRDSRAQRRRGRDLARLDLALRDLGPRLRQRPGWRPQHTAITACAGIDWQACVQGLVNVSSRLGAWVQAAAGQTRAALAAVGAGELPVTVIHGDFAEHNVHYRRGRIAGVIDFGLTHLDSRPYELAIARTYRAPETARAYRAELARSGWPLMTAQPGQVAQDILPTRGCIYPQAAGKAHQISGRAALTLRLVGWLVGLPCQHPNPGWLADGPEIMIRAVRKRRV